MKNIYKRHRYIKVCSYNRFNELVRGKGYFELQKFVCTKTPQLEKYFREEVDASTTIYIVYDSNAKIVVGYYTLASSCMIREYDEGKRNVVINREINVQKNIPCIEIEKFAVNEKYLAWLGKKGYNNKSVGYYIFIEYICKNIIYLSGLINFSFVILHSINMPKVIAAYKKMSFETFEDDETNIVSLLEKVSAIKESYVNECKFMYQPLEPIINKMLEGGMQYVQQHT